MTSRRKCSIAGCDFRIHARELCDKHYQRSRGKGGFEPIPATPPAHRLKAKLVQQPNGCLEFMGCSNPAGYGVMAALGKNFLTHRLAWEFANGPIPIGVFVCHKCDNPPCCNVEHLFLGTHGENMADMTAKGRGRRGVHRKTHCPHGHPYDEANTYVSPTGAWHCKTCSLSRTKKRRQKKAIRIATLEEK